MPASERSTDAAPKCFVLTEIRTTDGASRSAILETISGRDVTVTLAHLPLPGSHLELNLGEQGWVGGEVRWVGGRVLGAELERDVDLPALLGH